MPLHHRIIGAHVDLFRVDIVGALSGDILGNVHNDRPRATGSGDVKSLFQGNRQIRDILHQEIVLDAGTGNADRIDFLEGVVADQGGGNLTGDDHHGNGVHIGGGNAGHRIGRARAGGHQHHTGFTGGTGVTIRGMGCSLLMADQNMFDLFLLVEGVVYMQDGATRIAEEVFDTFILEKTRYNFGTGQFHRESLP